MTRAAPLLACWLLHATVARGAPEQLPEKKTTIAILPTVLDKTAEAEVPGNVDEVVLTAVQSAGDFIVTGRDDIYQMLTHEQLRQFTGCDDSVCMAEIVGALGAKKLVVFSISFIDGQWLVTGKVIQPMTALVLARATKIIGGEPDAVVRVIPAMVGEMFGVEMAGLATMIEVGSAADSVVNFHIDAANALLYGPSIAVELGTTLTGVVRVRFLNLGVMNQVGLGFRGVVPVERGESFEFGIAPGLGGRWYFGKDGNMRGLYFGVAAEYWYVRVVDDDIDREAYITHSIAVQAEGGYRFVLDHFILGAGISLGYLGTVAKSTEDLSGGRDRVLYQAQGASTVVGGVAFEIGYLF